MEHVETSKPDCAHHVVIVGAGFGGLATARALEHAPVRITLIDKHNYHLFQPLLYQAATASLAVSEIAWPIRQLLARRKEVTTLLATAVGIDCARHQVTLDDGATVAYDTLVLATGARHAYFGHDEWERFAPGLKTLDDATAIRRRVLTAFECAERESDIQRRDALLTFVIIGGGPTGVELAGTIAELAHETLHKEFRTIDTRTAKIVLIEAGERLLPGFADSLARYAHSALQRLGVEVLLGNAVSKCTSDAVFFGERVLPAKTLLWAAGVQASPAAKWLNAPADRANRVQVQADLTAPGHAEIFVIGDTATVNAWNGKPVPGIAPAAKQQGRHVAKTIRARLRGDHATRPFHYHHAGSLATIGKRCAIIDFGWMKLRGWLAWWIWGSAHIYFLIGVRNRIAVAFNWLWIYATGNRSARLITQDPARQQEE
ncbi:MAG TPA: NAD(P)/FAD-dependent oxidoreductase [Rudaea sp.]|nr:NAD(P)/FAD-dependent oxidoreductase [Rudaea sp.]